MSYILFNWLLTINQKNASRLQRSYQTHSHNIHFKIIGLVRWFFKENLSSSRIYCCYIILSTELKLSCLIISSVLKEKKNCPFLLLENSRCLSPPRAPQTPFSSLGTLDFLSTCLGLALSKAKWDSNVGR